MQPAVEIVQVFDNAVSIRMPELTGDRFELTVYDPKGEEHAVVLQGPMKAAKAVHRIGDLRSDKLYVAWVETFSGDQVKESTKQRGFKTLKAEDDKKKQGEEQAMQQAPVARGSTEEEKKTKNPISEQFPEEDMEARAPAVAATPLGVQTPGLGMLPSPPPQLPVAPATAAPAATQKEYRPEWKIAGEFLKEKGRDGLDDCLLRELAQSIGEDPDELKYALVQSGRFTVDEDGVVKRTMLQKIFDVMESDVETFKEVLEKLATELQEEEHMLEIQMREAIHGSMGELRLKMAQDVELLEHVFTAMFVVEVIIRVMAEGWIWIWSLENVADFSLIFGTGVIPLWILGPIGIKSDAVRIIQVLRVLRLHQGACQEAECPWVRRRCPSREYRNTASRIRPRDLEIPIRKCCHPSWPPHLAASGVLWSVLLHLR